MRAEQRGQVTRVCLAANREAEGAGEQAKAVCDFEAGRVRRLPEGQGQQGSGWSRRGVDRGV